MEEFKFESGLKLLHQALNLQNHSQNRHHLNHSQNRHHLNHSQNRHHLNHSQNRHHLNHSQNQHHLSHSQNRRQNATKEIQIHPVIQVLFQENDLVELYVVIKITGIPKSKKKTVNQPMPAPSPKKPEPSPIPEPKQSSEPLSSNDEPIFLKFKRKKKMLENKQKSTVKRFKIKRKQPVVNPQNKPENKQNTQKTNNKQPEKHICNNRNPAPPCKPGFISRKRPNGSLCCYKDYTKPAQSKKFKIKRLSKKANNPTNSKGKDQQNQKNSSKKIKQIVGKNLVKIIEKVDELDYAYKPTVYEDIDVKLDFTKLDKNIQKYILVLDKANLNFNFNRPLAFKQGRIQKLHI